MGENISICRFFFLGGVIHFAQRRVLQYPAQVGDYLVTLGLGMSKKEYQVSPFGMHNFIKLLCFQLSISLLPSFFLPVILKSRAANLP